MFPRLLLPRCHTVWFAQVFSPKRIKVEILMKRITGKVSLKHTITNSLLIINMSTYVCGLKNVWEFGVEEKCNHSFEDFGNSVYITLLLYLNSNNW